MSSPKIFLETFLSTISSLRTRLNTPSWWNALQTVNFRASMLDACIENSFLCLLDHEYNFGHHFQINWIWIHSCKVFSSNLCLSRFRALKRISIRFSYLLLGREVFSGTRACNPAAQKKVLCCPYLLCLVTITLNTSAAFLFG